MDFSKIREMRKQNKREVSRASLGNEEEFVSSNAVKNAKETDNSDNNVNPFHKTISTVSAYFKHCNILQCCSANVAKLLRNGI